MEIPCIFAVDPDTKEANGAVAPFCTEGCRNKAGGEHYPGFKAASLGISHLADFGYTPHCEECGNEIIEMKTQGWSITWSSNVTAKDIMPFGFHLEDGRLMPDSMDEIRCLLGNGFIVTDVTHPKTESTRGLPSRSVHLERRIVVPTAS